MLERKIKERRLEQPSEHDGWEAVSPWTRLGPFHAPTLFSSSNMLS